MKKSTIVLGLVILVVAIFLFKPDLVGRGDNTPLFAVIVPADDLMAVPTSVVCDAVSDCDAYVLSEDPSATDVKTTCDGTCTIYVEKTPLEVIQ